MKHFTNFLKVLPILFSLCSVTIGRAQEEPESSTSEVSELAQQAQNPVADLISLPFQNNTSFGIGPDNRVQNTLNIQPVYPIKLNENWNLITRTIMPIITQPDLSQSSGSSTGLGDISFTGFFSPSKPSKIIWGAGPAISIPTASRDIPGFERWAIGPSVVALTIRGPWVIGVLTNNIWSIGSSDTKPDVNFLLFQYFINYNLSNGLYLVSAPIITNNWLVDKNLILPFGGGLGKLFKLGKLPINANIQAYYNAVTPDNGPTWSSRLQLQFMFPK